MKRLSILGAVLSFAFLLTVAIAPPASAEPGEICSDSSDCNRGANPTGDEVCADPTEPLTALPDVSSATCQSTAVIFEDVTQCTKDSQCGQGKECTLIQHPAFGGGGNGVCTDSGATGHDFESDKNAPPNTGVGTDNVGFAKSTRYGLSALTGTNLYQGSPQTLIVNLVRQVFLYIGAILVIMIVFGGVTYMTGASSAGGGANSKRIEHGKRIITAAIVGTVIVFSAYLIAEFVIRALTAV